MKTYDDAITEAATAQGLDPIALALAGAGYAVALEQTGGFCMVLALYSADGTERLWITRSDYEGRWSYGDIHPGWTVRMYDDEDDWNGEGVNVLEHATTQDVIDLAGMFRAGDHRSQSTVEISGALYATYQTNGMHGHITELVFYPERDPAAGCEVTDGDTDLDVNDGDGTFWDAMRAALRGERGQVIEWKE